MAEEFKIGAKLELGGEKEFTSAVNSANRSLSSMKSQFKLVAAETKGQANSLDTLQKKQTALIKVLDATIDKEQATADGLENAQKNYSRVGEELATYKTALSEAQEELAKMQASGTATEEELTAQQEKVDALQKTVDKGTDTYEKAGQRVNAWEKKLVDAKTATVQASDAVNENNKYLEEAQNSTDGLAKSIDEYGKKVPQAKSKTEELGDTLDASIARTKAIDVLNQLSEAMQKVASSAYDSTKELDEGYDIIAEKTGAVGKNLDDLSGIADDIFGSMPVQMADVGTAIGEVNTRFGLQGQELQSLSEKFLKFAQINGTDLNSSIDTVQKALGAFGLTTADASDLLDSMTAAGQATGVEMGELGDALVKNAAALQEMGLSAYDSVEFIGQLEKSGVDSETALSGLSRALKNATKDGKPLDQALSELDDTIVNGTDSMSGLQASYDLFGKSGDKIYNAVKQGTISFKGLAGTVKDFGGIVEQTYDATIDPWDEFTTQTNNLKLAGTQLVKSVLVPLTPAIKKVTTATQALSDGISKLPEPVQTTIGLLGTGIAGVGIIAPKITSMAMSLEVLKAAHAANAAAATADAAATDVATASATAFNAALGAVMLNPLTIGLVGITAAVVALGKAFGTEQSYITDFGSAASQAMKDASAATDELKTSMDSAKDSVANAMAQSDTADELVTELESLASQSSRTADEQAKMEGIVNTLNAMFPDLGASIDTSTGALNMSTDAIKDYVKNAEKVQMVKAYADASTEAWEAVAKASVEATKNQNVIDGLNEQIADLQKQADAITNSNGAMVEFNNKTMDSQSALMEINGAISATQGEIDKATKKQGELSDAVDAAKTDAEAYTQAQSDMAAEMGMTADAAGEMASSTEEAAGAVEGAGNSASNTAGEVDELTQALQSAKQSAYDSVDAFEKLDGTAASLSDMEAALQSQSEVLSNYSENIGKVQSAMSGMDAGTAAAAQSFLSTVAGMGTEGAGYLQALVEAIEAGDGTAEQYLQDFGSMQAAKDNWAESIAEITTTTADGMNSVNASVANGTEQTARTIDQSSGTLQNAANNARNAAVAGFNPFTGQAIQIARDGVSGYAYSISQGAAPAGSAANQVKDTAVGALNGDGSGAGSHVANTYASGLSAGAGQAGSAASGVAESARSNLAAMNAWTEGNRMAFAYAEGISAGVWKIEQAAKGAANAAAAYLHHSTPDKGPLKGDDKWGTEMIENFAAGMLGGERSIKLASETIANAAAFAPKIGDSIQYSGMMAKMTQAGRNVNFTQINNSPKALSRLEIYRQTKNALGAVK